MKIENSKLKIVFFGTPDFVLPVLKQLIQSYAVIGVVTAPDQRLGRKKILTASPVKQFAINHAVHSIITPEQLNHETMQQLAALSPDLFVVAAYGKIISQNILDIPTHGAINIHPSLLPKYRGPSPIQAAILNGDTETGLSIIKMDEKMDHGPLLHQSTYPLSATDTFASLHHAMFQEAAGKLPTIIDDYIAGKIVPQEQDHTKATFCKMISKADGFFTTEQPPDSKLLDRMIRAYYPWPTAWTEIRLKNQEIRKIKFLPEQRVQLEGGKPMTMKDLLNGHPELQGLLETLLFE